MNIKNAVVVTLTLLTTISVSGFAQEKNQPNVIIIITDDQGYGDLGITGNPHVKHR